MTISEDATRKTVAELGIINTPLKTRKDVKKYVISVLEPLCDRFVCGTETGEDGYEHLQSRMVLKKETEIHKLATMLGQKGVMGHLSATKVRDFDYVEKENDYYRSWEKSLGKYVDITPNLWQLLALDMWKKSNDREVVVVVDEKGNHGKSFLRKHLVATHQANFIPPMDRAEDIMALAYARPSKGYVIDLPKADGKVKKQMWSAIEQIKDGFLYDKRYNWKERWIDPPKVMVFCNDLETASLSSDRWIIYDITDIKV